MFVDSFPPFPPPSKSPAERPLEQLEHEICELSAQLSAQTCHWLGLVAEFDRREGWASWGVRSCADWLAWKCAISAPTAREHVRVARAIEVLPLIRGAFGRGELSYSKARALTRVATPDCEAELVEFAACATAAQLERAVRAYKRVKRLEDVQEAHSGRYLSHFWDDDGSLVISARLPAEQGAVVLAALRSAKDALDAADVSAETPGPDDGANVSAETATLPAVPDGVRQEAPDNPAGARAADALVLIADTLLSHGPSARSGGDRYQVLVHVDTATLATHPDDDPDDHECDRCELGDGPGLHPETVRRLACDASVVAVSERAGRPLDVGRKTRTIAPALRRALSARDDGRCRFPGCQHTRYLQAHHIEHWAHGGTTDLENLITLCSFHHRLLHEGRCTVERTPSGDYRFSRPDGRPIPAAPVAPALTGPSLRARNQANGHTIGHDTNLHGPGERMHLPFAVDALITWIDAKQHSRDPPCEK